MKRLLAGALMSCCAVTLAGHANAETIVLEADKTVLVNMADRPGTVVVGNPSIADVSLNGKQVFLHGRGYGNTNIIVLDLQGNQLASLDVAVKQAQSDAVTVYRGLPKNNEVVYRVSLQCAPTCEHNLQIGDNPDFYQKIFEANKAKNELATGSKTAEAEAPSAAQ
jgi:hypothetical protein